MFFCIEILGESAFHKFLIQSGWSGRDYVFHYNRPTNSHMRAYRSIEEYYSERVDMHKAVNIWPLLGNLLPTGQIEPHVFVAPAFGQPLCKSESIGEDDLDASGERKAAVMNVHETFDRRSGDSVSPMVSSAPARASGGGVLAAESVRDQEGASVRGNLLFGSHDTRKGNDCRLVRDHERGSSPVPASSSGQSNLNKNQNKQSKH